MNEQNVWKNGVKKLVALGWSINKETNSISGRNGTVVEVTEEAILFVFKGETKFYEIKKTYQVAFVLDRLGELNLHLGTEDITLRPGVYSDILEIVKVFKIKYQLYADIPENYAEHLSQQLEAASAVVNDTSMKLWALNMFRLLTL